MRGLVRRERAAVEAEAAAARARNNAATELSHEAVGYVEELVVPLSHVVLVRRQVRVDEEARGGANAERYPHTALIP